jgi:hypothetical protein
MLTGNQTVGIVAQALVGQGADAAFGVAGVEVHQGVGVDRALGVVEPAQFGREQLPSGHSPSSPGWNHCSRG